MLTYCGGLVQWKSRTHILKNVLNTAAVRHGYHVAMDTLMDTVRRGNKSCGHETHRLPNSSDSSQWLQNHIAFRPTVRRSRWPGRRTHLRYPRTRTTLRWDASRIPLRTELCLIDTRIPPHLAASSSDWNLWINSAISAHLSVSCKCLRSKPNSTPPHAHARRKNEGR